MSCISRVPLSALVAIAWWLTYPYHQFRSGACPHWIEIGVLSGQGARLVVEELYGNSMRRVNRSCTPNVSVSEASRIGGRLL